MTETLRFCKFCGQNVVAPCMDATDISIYRRTVDRCSDAAFNYEGERHFERRTVRVTSTHHSTEAK